MDTSLAKEFVHLDTMIKDLDRSLKDAKKKREELGKKIMDQMVDEEINRISLNGKTLYIKRTIWAKYPNREDAIQALKDAGLDEYVKENFNNMQLSAFLREKVEAEEPLPEAFAGRIEPNEVFQVVSVKA